MTSDDRERNLQSVLYYILDIVPERDLSLEGVEFLPKFFDATNLVPEKWRIQLIFMQLAKFEYHTDKAARSSVRRLLCDFKHELSPAVRVFASDLIDLPPIKKPKKNTTLARDILIIMALIILKEIGTDPTMNEATQSDDPSGSKVVFDYLKNVRELRFPKNEKTIESIWSDRPNRFKQIGLGEFVLD